MALHSSEVQAETPSFPVVERHPLESFGCPDHFIGASYHCQMSSLRLHIVTCKQTMGQFMDRPQGTSVKLALLKARAQL